ncbi:hypothetical protein MCC10004_1366 [Bifidobacterium longum subsp. longum]|uniref:Uncharacterized protein n=1 Tax=Bifidobacterium longum subsp. longum TaxID=1679 RepID=A0A4R0SAA0_BIFLL|nr:hypothetical protein MCC10004_1366 [Bifidobacterium longum subsp. longum]
MLIPSIDSMPFVAIASLSRRVNANSQLSLTLLSPFDKLIKKGEC